MNCSRIFNIILIIPFILIGQQRTENGCTDPYADNYDQNANVDDESCTYLEKWYIGSRTSSRWRICTIT